MNKFKECTSLQFIIYYKREAAAVHYFLWLDRTEDDDERQNKYKSG